MYEPRADVATIAKPSGHKSRNDYEALLRG